MAGPHCANRSRLFDADPALIAVEAAVIEGNDPSTDLQGLHFGVQGEEFASAPLSWDEPPGTHCSAARSGCGARIGFGPHRSIFLSRTAWYGRCASPGLTNLAKPADNAQPVNTTNPAKPADNAQPAYRASQPQPREP